MLTQLERRIRGSIRDAKHVCRAKLVSGQHLQFLKAEYNQICRDWAVHICGYPKPDITRLQRLLFRLRRWLTLAESRHFRTSALDIYSDHPASVRSLAWFRYRCGEEGIIHRLRSEGVIHPPKRYRCPLTRDMFLPGAPVDANEPYPFVSGGGLTAAVALRQEPRRSFRC
ncbi:hypothetical protein [Marinobacterium arenosum]|uniref:hypothetical protein n=1 Tax=Marinobacterium arenosum TaxID=2862496 RepID=UPI001C9786CD|nr:hypothetical protein [Marinobacterium arenosum]MBY4675903.1 hypothetical protein [Marinobacterium arenosum]